MAQPVKVPEPSMEEILASIRRIIADDDTGKAQGQPAASAAANPASAVSSEAGPAPAGSKESVGMSQSEVDAMLSDRALPKSEGDRKEPSGGPEAGILELTEDMAARNPLPASFRAIDAESDVIFSDASAAAPLAAPGPSSERARPGEPPRPSELPHASEPARLDEPRPPSAPLRPSEALRSASRNALEEPLLSSATNAAVDAAFNALARTVLVDNSRTLEDLVREMLRPMLKSWLDDNLPGLVERLVRAEIERVSRGRV